SNVHIFLMSIQKPLANPATPFKIRPINCNCIQFQTTFIAPVVSCLTPSHIFDQSPVNNPLKIFTAPMMTSSVPVMLPLMLPQIILMTIYTAFIAKPMTGLITVSNAHLTLSTNHSTIGDTQFDILLHASLRLGPSWLVNSDIFVFISPKKLSTASNPGRIQSSIPKNTSFIFSPNLSMKLRNVSDFL